jgi:hypothetical protein
LVLKEIATYAGQPPSTLFGWLNGTDPYQVECVLKLLELLPDSKRNEVINRICRHLPTISGDEIGWAETQVIGLQRALHARTGVSFVQGEENARGFLVTALGHHALRSSTAFHKVSGIDVRLPEYFVPVPGVEYLKQPSSGAVVREATDKLWSSVSKKLKHLLLLNGIWLSVPHLHSEILSMAVSNHVVISDAFRLSARQVAALTQCPKRLLTVESFPKDRLKVTIEEA